MKIQNYLKEVLLVILVTLIMGLYFIIIYFNYEKKEKDITYENVVSENTFNSKSVDEFYVEIKGEVLFPGVYQVNSQNIINDVVTLAGGFTEKAYTNNINLSYLLEPQMVIYIYSETEYKKDNPKVIYVYEECNCPTYEITQCEDKKESVIVTDQDKTTEQEQETNSVLTEEKDNNKSEVLEKEGLSLININTATKDQLMSLSGIGEAKAKNIIKYREENGLFTDVSQIVNVSGISQKMYDSIKEYITV